MRFLVTGCAGFIGSHLSESLLQEGHEVVGVDCFNDNYGRPQKLANLRHIMEFGGFEFVPIDLSRGNLQELVAECDGVFHLAAEPGVRSSWGSRFDAYARNNVLATQLLLEAARPFPDRPFVYASSSSIYGQAEAFPTTEDVVPRPLSPYGVTKLAAEHLCALYQVNHGVRTTSLRYFSVYGPRQRPDMAFHRFCLAALKGQALAVYGDGSQTRDFTYVGDIVDATRAAALPCVPAGGVYNIGGGSRISLRAAIDVLADVAGARLDVEHLPTESGDVRDTGADTSRAARALGFTAGVTLKEGLSRELEWCRSMLAAGSL